MYVLSENVERQKPRQPNAPRVELQLLVFARTCGTVCACKFDLT